MDVPEIATLRLEDILSGASAAALGKFRVQYTAQRSGIAISATQQERPASEAPSDAGGAGKATPLDDVAAALYADYLQGEWCHERWEGQRSQQGQRTNGVGPDLSCAPHQGVSEAPAIELGGDVAHGAAPPVPALPAQLYVPLLRAVLLPWGEGAQAASASFPSRLARCWPLGQALGVPPAAHQQALVAALEHNRVLGAELQQQIQAIQQGQLPGVVAGDPAMSQEGVRSWCAAALHQVEGLQRWYAQLPPCTALLQVEVVGAQQLRHDAGKRSTPPSSLNPYASLVLVDKSGHLLSKRCATDICCGTPAPSWGLQLPPLPISDTSCDLLIKVKHSSDGRSRSSGDTDIGRTGLCLQGLPVGWPVQAELELVGQRVAQPAKAKATASASGAAGQAKGRSKAKGGAAAFLCGCFGGRSTALAEEEAEAERRQGQEAVVAELIDEGMPMRQAEEGPGAEDEEDGGPPSKFKDTRVVFLPSRGAMVGAAERAQQGRVVLEVTYVEERRDGQKAQQVAGAALYQTLPQHPLAGNAASGTAPGRSRLDVGRDFRASQATQPQWPSSAPSSSPSPPPFPDASIEMFVRLAANLSQVNRTGRSQQLQPCSATWGQGTGGANGTSSSNRKTDSPSNSASSSLPEATSASFRFNRGSRAAKQQAASGGATSAGCSPAFECEGPTGGATEGVRSALRSLVLPPLLRDLLLDPGLAPVLPLGWGLPLLLALGKLHHVRPHTQLLVLLQHLLLESGAASTWAVGPGGGAAAGGECGGATLGSGLLHTVRAWLRRCLVDQSKGALTSSESKALAGVMGLFLHAALPALHCHYARFPPGSPVTPLVTLLELAGWAVTCDPRSQPPVPLLQQLLEGAAAQRMHTELRVSMQQLPESLRMLTEEVKCASRDLQRDIEIQDAVPALSGLVARTCRLRYHTLQDHCDMVFAYRPGANGAAMQELYHLEAAVQAHHTLLRRHDLAPAEPTTPTPTAPPDCGSLGAEQWQLAERQGQGQGQGQGATMALYDFEGSMIDALQQWLRLCASELEPRCRRLLAEEQWVALSNARPFANSCVELSRMIQASLDAWLEAVCSGGTRRRRALGPLLMGCTAGLLVQYTQGMEACWDQLLASRDMELGCDAAACGHGSSPSRNTQGHRRAGSVGATSASAAASARLSPGGAPANGNGSGSGHAAGVGVGGGGGVTQASLASAAAAAARLQRSSARLGSGRPTSGASGGAGRSAASVVSLLDGPAPSAPSLRSMGVRSMLVTAHRCSPNDSRRRPTTTPSLATSAASALGMGLPSSSSRTPGPTSYLATTTTASPETHNPHKPPSDSGVGVNGGVGAVGHHRSGSGPEALLGLLRGVEPGLVLTDHMCTLRASLAKVVSDSLALSNSLTTQLLATTASQGNISLGEPPSLPASAPGPGPDEERAALGAAWQWAGGEMARVCASVDTSYAVQLRDILLRLLRLAFGSKPAADAAACEQALGGVLMLVHDELSCLTRNFQQALQQPVLQPQRRRNSHNSNGIGNGTSNGYGISNGTIASNGMSTRPSPNKSQAAGCASSVPPGVDVSGSCEGSSGLSAVRELVWALWGGAVSALQLLALHQAGFRPLTAAEADQAHGFLLSLQDMFEGELPRCLVPHLQPLAPPAWALHHTPGISDLLPTTVNPHLVASSSSATVSAVRAVNHMYCSDLLQKLSADPQDLCDMYKAQLSALQHLQQGTQGPFVQLGPQQVSLLDLLRLLRQRAEGRPDLKAIVREQLRSATAIATQVLFGLSSSEQVLAEFPCFLATGPDAAAAAAAADGGQAGYAPHPRPGHLAAPASAPSHTPLPYDPSGRAPVMVQGRLYLTRSCLCYTTLLDGDSVASDSSSDTTLALLRGQVWAVEAAARFAAVQGAVLPCVVVRTTSQETYCLAGFASGDSSRLMALLGQAAAPPPLPHALLSAQQVPTPRSQAPTHGAVADEAMASKPQTQGLAQPQGPPATAAAAAGVRQTAHEGLEPQPRRVLGRERASLEAVGGKTGTTGATGAGATTTAGALPQRNGTRVGAQAAEVSTATQATTTVKTAATNLQQQQQQQQQGVAAASQGPVACAPCHLVGSLFNTDGQLHVYSDHVEFVSAHRELVHSFPLDCIELIRQRAHGGASILSLQVRSLRGRNELVLGGMTDPLIASLKHTISSLCSASG